VFRYNAQVRGAISGEPGQKSGKLGKQIMTAAVRKRVATKHLAALHAR